jgi:hypothetical protein
VKAPAERCLRRQVKPPRYMLADDHEDALVAFFPCVLNNIKQPVPNLANLALVKFEISLVTLCHGATEEQLRPKRAWKFIPIANGLTENFPLSDCPKHFAWKSSVNVARLC